jgi:hypothetical protein
MDKLTEYPRLIERIFTEYIELCNRHRDRDISTQISQQYKQRSRFL